VSAHLELSEDGKAMKFYEVNQFVYTLTPEAIAAAAVTLAIPDGVERNSEERS